MESNAEYELIEFNSYRGIFIIEIERWFRSNENFRLIKRLTAKVLWFNSV